jgi:hypothetical protein
MKKQPSALSLLLLTSTALQASAETMKTEIKLPGIAFTRMVSVRTIGTSDDNNHDVIEAKSVYMKISSDTKTVGFYYSLDKTIWQLIRLFKNDYPAAIGVGISTQSPLGEGTSAVFEDVSLTRQSISDFRRGI